MANASSHLHGSAATKGRCQLFAPTGHIIYTSQDRGWEGYLQLVDFVHSLLDVSVLHATTKMDYRFEYLPS